MSDCILHYGLRLRNSGKVLPNKWGGKPKVKPHTRSDACSKIGQAKFKATLAQKNCIMDALLNLIYQIIIGEVLALHGLAK